METVCQMRLSLRLALILRIRIRMETVNLMARKILMGMGSTIVQRSYLGLIPLIPTAMTMVSPTVKKIQMEII